MFSDIFITIAAWIYVHAFVLLAIMFALVILNGVRKLMRAWRRQRWIQNTLRDRQNQNVDWTMLEKL